ncbi:MAG: hypothetical protein WC438_00185 [Candidatus Pacearchaeota archaeon]
MKSQLFVFSLVLILSFSLIYPVLATTAAAQGQATVHVSPGETIDRVISVPNQNDFPVNIIINASTDTKNIIKIKTPEFTLQPGDTKKVELTIKVLEEAKSENKINVLFKPLNESQNPAGIVVKITTIPDKNEEIDEEDSNEIIDNPDNTEDADTNSSITGNLINDMKETINIPITPINLAIGMTLITLILFIVALILLFRRTKQGIELVEQEKEEKKSKSKKKVKRNE